MALVAVEATRCRLVAVPRLRIHDGDDAVRSHPPRNAEGATLRLLQVLSHHGGQQLRRALHLHRQGSAIEDEEGRVGIARQSVDECFPGHHVIPLTLWLPCGGVVVVAAKHLSDVSCQLHVCHPQKATEGRADECHRVLRRHCVIERRRVQHPLAAHQPRRAGYLQTLLEDAIGSLGAPQSRPHVHQHRVHEAGVVKVQPAGRVLPPQVEAKAVHGLSVAQPLQPLQHHHHRQDARRYRPAPDAREEVPEVLLWKEPMTLRVQQRVDGRRREALVAEVPAGAEHITLCRRVAKRHGPQESSIGLDFNHIQRPPRGDEGGVGALLRAFPDQPLDLELGAPWPFTVAARRARRIRATVCRVRNQRLRQSASRLRRSDVTPGYVLRDPSPRPTFGQSRIPTRGHRRRHARAPAPSHPKLEPGRGHPEGRRGSRLRPALPSARPARPRSKNTSLLEASREGLGSKGLKGELLPRPD